MAGSYFFGTFVPIIDLVISIYLYIYIYIYIIGSRPDPSRVRGESSVDIFVQAGLKMLVRQGEAQQDEAQRGDFKFQPLPRGRWCVTMAWRKYVDLMLNEAYLTSGASRRRSWKGPFPILAVIIVGNSYLVTPYIFQGPCLFGPNAVRPALASSASQACPRCLPDASQMSPDASQMASQMFVLICSIFLFTMEPHMRDLGLILPLYES